MSSLKDKMYNYEVTPPSTTWDKITIDLDESELSNKFPAKLYHHTATVPAAATWEKIAVSLEESGLSNKFPEKLYNLETIPPTTVWEKINEALNPPEPKMKPLTGGLSPLWRYAAAAILVGAIAFTIVRLTVNTNVDVINTANLNTAKDTASPEKSEILVENEPAISPGPLNEDDKALEESKKMVAKLDRPVKSATGNLNAYTAASQLSYISNVDKELSQSIYAYEDHVPNISERYVMLMTPDGNIIRMSKKWSQLVCCVAGEDQDPNCIDQLKKWQQKIATSSLAPSTGNFMDILNLVNSLSEDSEL